MSVGLDVPVGIGRLLDAGVSHLVLDPSKVSAVRKEPRPEWAAAPSDVDGLEHLYMTLRRVLAGVVIGVALGVLLGLVMGSVGWVRSVLEPWLTFLRALPPLAYFFLLVIWLGIDEAPEDHTAGSGCVAAGGGRDHRRGRRRTRRPAGSGSRSRCPPHR